MSVYADANLLIKLCLDLDGSEAERLLAAPEVVSMWPLPVTDLLRLEVRNGIQRMVFESRNGGVLCVAPEVAAAGQALFDELLEEGRMFARVSLTLQNLETRFDQLVLRHTARHGFRTYDILHVASALELNCARFYSFDRKAGELAMLEGLETISTL